MTPDRGPVTETRFGQIYRDGQVGPPLGEWSRCGSVRCPIGYRDKRPGYVERVNKAFSEVALVDSRPLWVNRFARTAHELRSVFPQASIEHVGSTSVPGLASKDTVDVAVGVPSLSHALDDGHIDLLRALGFEYISASFVDDPDHAFLHRIVEDRRTDHVHVVKLGSSVWIDYLLFRDYLRATPEALSRYEQAKRELAARYAKQRDRYVSEKQPIVEALMTEARSWQSGGGGASQ